jgi:hypothetical protein
MLFRTCPIHRWMILFSIFWIVLACNIGAKNAGVKPPLPAGAASTYAANQSRPTPTPETILDVPVTSIQLHGESYQAFQIPGESFRFLCPSPCGVDTKTIAAQYSGFRAGKSELVDLMGVDTLEEIQPVDIHIKNDGVCGSLNNSPALSFAARGAGENARICTFLFEYIKGFNNRPYGPEDAIRLDQQSILLHEYLHTIFFRRITSQAGAMHDFVTPLAIYISENKSNTYQPCVYHPQTAPGDYGGYLLQKLCTQNAFRLETIAPAMQRLDQLYQSGGGIIDEGYKHASPSMGQFRQILDTLLGSDTRNAFAEACWPAKLFEDSYNLSDACLYPTATIQPTLAP